MKKLNRNKKRILSIVLSCAMMVSLFVGITPMEVKAANFYPPIIDTDSITLYESGCLKKFDITVQTSAYYADAYGRIGVHNAKTSYDWYNRFIGVGCTNWPDESEFKAKDSTFLAFANGNQFMWTDQQEHRVTVEFDDGEVDLSQTGTYYIYLWTISDQYGIYTDALIGTVGTENGVLKDSNGNTLIDSSATAPEVTYDITLDRTNYAEGYVDLYTYDGEGRSVENTQENNATITMPEGGKVRVFADSEFTVTAEGATVSEMLNAGDEGYYYEITGITADTTVVVNKVTTQEQTYELTIDCAGFTEDAPLVVITLDSDGYDIDTIEVANGDKVEIPVGCSVIVASTTPNFKVAVENNLADVSDLQQGAAECGYVIDNIQGDITIVVESTTQGGGNETPPATDTYNITLDRTNYAEGYVDLYTYDGEGRSVENTQENNDTITMPEGGKVRVFADSEFTVTAEGATVSEMLSAGDEGYYYEITGIAADTTIVVNLKQNTPVVVAPAITSQPQNISVQEGQKATFSVTATGDNLSYQWQINRNDGNGFVNLSGATSASYTTSTVDMDCNGFKYQCIVSNEGGSVTTNIATLKVTESTSVHTHSLTLVPAKAATCTTAGNKAYYTCSGCDSLFADANGTTITTAEAVKVAALDHDWSGEWTIIKEATATEEGKKETFCARGCGQKKVVIIPVTGTTDDNGNFEKDAEVESDAPIDEATLNNSKEELLETGNIFTDEEKTQIEDGAEARVWLEIAKTDESAIASTDKAKIEQEAAKIMGDNLIITYFDADLFKQVGTNEKTPVPEPGIAIKITIAIPDELLNSDNTVSREYKIIRLHEGQVDVIDGTFDSATGEFTFESDKFSTYAIVYKDMPVNDADTPKPGDTDIPKPGDTDTPKPGDTDTPKPGDTDTPKPGDTDTPKPGDTDTPKPGDTDTPKPGGTDDTPTQGDADVIKPEDDKQDEVAKTGDSNAMLYSFMFMLLSGLGIIISSRKKKILNKES